MKDWQPIASAPFDRDTQVSVIEKGEVHAQNGWLRASAREQLFIDPIRRGWPAD
jgi:hypothetical protein